MTTVSQSIGTPRQSLLSAWITTGLLVALSDGLFASATGWFIRPRVTPFRVFRGVASVLFGKEALNGGTSTALIGILMHICVALFWSGVFILALRNSGMLREAIQNPSKAFVVAAVYGVSIWLIMSLIVIPVLVHHGPTIGPKYWVQLVGHIPFVATPMILVNRRRANS